MSWTSHAGHSGTVRLLLDAPASDDETNTNDLCKQS